MIDIHHGRVPEYEDLVRAWYYGIDEEKHADRDAYDEPWYRKYRERGHDMVANSGYFRVKPIVLQRVNALWRRSFPFAQQQQQQQHNHVKDSNGTITTTTTKILGVQMRGTDKGAGRYRVEPAEYVAYAVSFIQHYGVHNALLFVATDSKTYFERFVRLLGDVDARYPALVRSQRNAVRAVEGDGATFSLDGVDKHAIGLDVLTDLLCLARTHAFIHSASAVAEAVFYHNFALHSNSVHLEYTRKRQDPLWARSAVVRRRRRRDADNKKVYVKNVYL
jgi:hypothetical protein